MFFISGQNDKLGSYSRPMHRMSPFYHSAEKLFYLSKIKYSSDISSRLILTAGFHHMRVQLFESRCYFPFHERYFLIAISVYGSMASFKVSSMGTHL
jgi:hypothetical protein